MENSDIAAVFHEIADLLTIHGGNPHRIRAFARTARVVEGLPRPAAEMIRFGTLAKAPGLGDGSVRRIKNILKTGTCDEHLKLRKALPEGLRDMLEVKGVGPRTIRVIYQNLRIASIEELEAAIHAGAIQKLPRMGQKTAERILKGITDWRNRIGRVPWIDAKRWIGRLEGPLRANTAVQRLMIGGSVRRGKALVGDLDILVGADDRLAVVSHFLTLPEVDEVLVKGTGRASVRLHNRQQCDLRVLDPETFGAGMHYFTGSKLHNIAIRALGLKKFDRKISDKGIFDRHTEIRLSPAATEDEIFAAVGLPPIPPEIRENTGEIEAASAGRLPHLVTESDLRGDLHMHTTASDGKGSVSDMASAAIRMGHAYIAITDHTQTLTVANGLDARRLSQQARHIRDVEQGLGAIAVLAGTEVDILSDGRLDMDPEVLKSLDWVIASIHTGLGMSGSEITDRYIAAMETGLVDCIGHPETRRLGQRKGAVLDLDRLLKAARRLDVCIEINGNPYRMDLSEVGARRAKELGVPVCINTDAHAPGHLPRQEFGVVTARRGWIEPSDVLNAGPLERITDARRNRLRTHGVAVSGWSPPAESPPLPATAVAEPHWPEDEDDVASTEELDLSLPLADEVRARLDDWLRNGGDAPLEAALRAQGANPMQVAFNLLSGFQPE